MVVCLAVDYRSLVDKAHWVYLALLVVALRRAALRGRARRVAALARSRRLQPAAVGVRQGRSRAGAGQAARREPARGALQPGPLPRRGPDRSCRSLLIARQPDLGTAVTLLPVLGAVVFAAGLPLRYLGHRRAGRAGPRPDRLDVRPRGLPEVADRDLPRSRAGCARRRLPADPGAHHRRLGRRARARASCRARRGSCASCRWPTTTSSSRCWPKSRASPASSWRWRSISSSSSRSLDAARLSKDRVGAYPGARRAGQLHLPGRLQHHHVGGPGAGQGTHAAAHELRRVLDDRHARRLRPDSRTSEMRRFTNCRHVELTRPTCPSP